MNLIDGTLRHLFGATLLLALALCALQIIGSSLQ